MPRSTKHRGESSRASRRSEDDVQRTQDPMLYFTLSTLMEDDPERPYKGVKVFALGPLEESSPLEGVVDMRRVDRTERGYRYRRGDNYPGHFPLDEHLFPFIQGFIPANWEGPDGLLMSERIQLERAILVGRDSMVGTCGFHYPSFPIDYTAQTHFPEAGQLGLFSAEPVDRVRGLMLAQGLWEVHGLPKTGPTFTGRIPLPSGPEFVSEGYDRSCFLDRIMSKEAAGWYDRWSVISSHRFRFGATEWLMGILYHYHKLLDQVGLLHAVVAALHSYPCHSGLLQALVERFNRRLNTFCVADGETCLDLWALHRISGLPISGQFYEKVCLNDLLRDRVHRLRLLLWRDLARCGKGECPSASKGTVRVSCDAWLRFFYNGPFCFHKEFASESYDPADYLQLSVSLEDNVKYLYAPRGRGWNPRQLPHRTYLAAYLVYWLSTFVLPFGEEGNIRPEVIYPACCLASGVQLALAPATLANIFHGLGDLTASPSPRDRSIVLPTHYLSAWAGLLLPELCHNISLENPSMPLLFMFRNRPEQAHQQQLGEARRRLSFVPSAGQSGLDHACCFRDFRPYAEESRGGRIYRLPHSSASSASFRKEWLYCIRPSVLLFRKGGSLFMEPYFPHRFARNFGYDQAVPPNADFALPDRTYRGLDRHLVASSWWCFFIRRDPSQEFFIPEQRRDGRVDILYARWWTRHNKAFRERVDVVKAAEGAYLSRAGASVSSIVSKFLRREFLELAGKVSTVGCHRAKAQVTDPTERKARVEALEPLVRPEGSSVTSRGGGEPSLVYFWWRHFLLVCGYQVDTALSAFIPRDVSRAWERHLCHSIACVGLREFISWIENGTTLQHFWDAITEAGKVVKVPFDQVVLPPPFSQAPTESFIPPAALPKPDTSRSRKRRASREAGSSQPGAREGIPEPSASVGGALQTSGNEEVAGATLREDLTPPAEDIYNPTFDGTPSPDMTGLPQASPFEPGYVPGEASAGGGTAHRAIHSLLVSGPGGELPGFSDFAPGLLEGGTLLWALHCAITVTSPAVLPVRSPQEEGEVLERTVGEDDGTDFCPRVDFLLLLTLGFAGAKGNIPLDVRGAEIVSEMMEMGPLVAVFPPVATQAGGEDAPCGAMTAPLLSEPHEFLTAAGGDAPPPPFAAASPVGFAPFSSHGVLWPSEPQSIQMADNGGILETLMGLAQSAMEESSPPCLERVRGFLYRNTRAYHLMGYPRDP
ncbi:hypothetical protein Taro_014176 [Colocasia esculenta]|uniref:Aminotransferase-like plant mobile domain-containing protein n=1 Tax=Colocasia esculenta TaxID=4460 RepID=A0A843UE01_COLES|nr:hypothetical protein [Colocasia esculenta]